MMGPMTVLFRPALIARVICFVLIQVIWMTTLFINLEAQSPAFNFLTDRDAIQKIRPILIAHRGGVVGEDAAECSLIALRRAAKEGYHMVELDIRRSVDGIPILFHDRALLKACGKKGSVESMRAEQLTAIHYIKGSDHIVTVDTALGVCRSLGLGVMLDFKSGRNDLIFLKRVDELLERHQLRGATITFSGDEPIRKTLKGVLFTPTESEMLRLRNGDQVDLRNRFWFGLPHQLKAEDILHLKAAGAFIFPAINTFRYPADRHSELAKSDIKRLIEAGVDGFQIDSVYRVLFDELGVSPNY